MVAHILLVRRSPEVSGGVSSARHFLTPSHSRNTSERHVAADILGRPTQSATEMRIQCPIEHGTAFRGLVQGKKIPLSSSKCNMGLVSYSVSLREV